MPLTDSYGNIISTDSTTARDLYDKGVHLSLGANFGTVEAFQGAVKAAPGFALGYVALARAQTMAQQMQDAKKSIAMAEQLAAGTTQRERQHIQIMALVISGQGVEARPLVQAHVLEHPRDALIAQLSTSVFGLIAFSGDVAHEAQLLAYTTALLPHYGDDWWMKSMHAISLCETGQLDASDCLMEESLALNPRNANGSHFKAHAQYEAGEVVAGRTYLGRWIEDYDDRSLLHSHLSWHLALWSLQEGDEAGMWAVVDSSVGPQASKGMPLNVLTDTAAILYRANLAGFEVDASRWAALSNYAAEFFPQPGQSFADIHVALSHAMAGDGAQLAKFAETSKGYAADLVRPVARAWDAIARVDWRSALMELSSVMYGADRFGGSRAQRDLLELTYVNVLLKLNLQDEAQRRLKTRRPVLAGAVPVSGMLPS